MKILHVANYSVRMRGYINRVNNNFDRHDHIFYIVGTSHGKGDTIRAENVIFEMDYPDNWREILQRLLMENDRIILHSMDSKNTIKQKIYIKMLKEGKQFVWAIWGHDVYDAYWRAHKISVKHPVNYLKTQYQEYLRKKIIAKVAYIMAIPGDYEAVKRWYKTQAEYIFFNQISYGEESILELPSNHNKVLKVVVGHDAYPHCRHKETLEILKQYDDGKMEVYCPLPYSGDEPALVHDVIEYGHYLFCDRFNAFTEQVCYDDYCRFVNSMDVALYNHNRQMAEGNVLMFLYYGKKVFVSDENCIGDFFKQLGAEIYSMKDLNVESLNMPLTDKARAHNKKLIEYNLSDEAFSKTWEEAFGRV